MRTSLPRVDRWMNAEKNIQVNCKKIEREGQKKKSLSACIHSSNSSVAARESSVTDSPFPSTCAHGSQSGLE